MPIELPEELQGLRRGTVIGRLEGFTPGGGLVGWVCPDPFAVAAALPPSPQPDRRLTTGDRRRSRLGQDRRRRATGPLQVQLILEDLLNPGRCCLRLAELVAHRPRPDLPALGSDHACGFLFLGHSGVELPAYSSGLVVRAYGLNGGRHELAGSPLRLDTQAYDTLRELCHLGLSRPARLLALEGTLLRGGAYGGTPLQLRVDGGDDPIPIPPSDPEEEGSGWYFQVPLPSRVCDGAVHLLQLETQAGELIDERLDLVPFQLTPFQALLEHGQTPFPDHLSPLARERQRNLLQWLQRADRSGLPLPAQLPLWQRLVSQPLRRDGEGLALPAGCEPDADGMPVPRVPLDLPIAAEPQVSIVIPVHGQYAVTRRCLAAIAYAATTVPYEVIVVDDGSLDGTAALLAAEAPGVRVVRHDFNRGFNQACCSGAAAARAPMLVLLNNDTEPCAHWLEELLDPFERWSDTGLVGPQLITADGRLQEAGGIVWGNGEPWNYGRGGNPHDPRYSYARRIDYASGAALAIAADLWRQVGGFSPEFSPAYYEDTDLAFKVREAGLSVRYAPLARVIHHEGISNGSDTEAAQQVKRYQSLNAPLFCRKWQHAFRGAVDPNLADAELIKDRDILGRALFLDHDTPRPDRDAGSHAACVEMELVQALGWKVSFLPANLAWMGGYSEDLQRRGIEVLHAPFVLSLDQLLRDRGREFDLIYITRYTVAAMALPLITRHAPQARLLFCNADLHHLRELRAARALALEGESAERAFQQVEEVRRQELAVMRQVHLTLTYSEVEQAVIEVETLGAAATSLCPWVVEGPEQPLPLAGRRGLAFLGSYTHPPNCDAIESFLDQVWPELRARHPELSLHVYGSGLLAELSARWQRHAGVVIEGWVVDPAVVYSRHRVFIAPLRSGAGLKGKVVAAAAHGIPQVLSPVAAEATGLRHGQEVLIAGDPQAWVAGIGTLLSDDALWEAMSRAAHSHARQTWSRPRALQLMGEALSRLHLPIAPEVAA